MNALFSATLESRIDASLDVARANSDASQRELMAPLVKKVLHTITTPLLSYLQVSIRKRISDHVRGFVDRQRSAWDFLVKIVPTLLEQRIPLHPQPSP